jgi:uncharacterized membrane protein
MDQFISFKNAIDKNSRLVLALIIVLGAGLRFYRLDFQSLWLDELSSMIGSAPWNTVDVIVEYCRKDQPPLFFLLIHYWMKLLGYNALSARLFVSIIGVLGIPAVYFLGREIKNKSTGLIAAFLTAINYFQLFFSQDVRFYSLLFLLSTLSYLFFIRVVRRKGIIDFVCYLIFSVLLFYTHYFSLVVYLSQFILFILVVICVAEGRERLIKLAVIFTLLSSICDLWWARQYFADSATSQFWIGVISPWFLGSFFISYFEDIVGIIVFISVGIFYLTKISFQFIKRGESIEINIWILMGWIFLGYAIPLGYSLLKEPMLIARYTMVVLPAVLTFIALAIQKVLSFRYQTYVLILVFFSFLFYLFVTENYYGSYHKTQWRELSREVLRDSTDNYAFFSKYDFYFNNYFYQLTGSNHIKCSYPDPTYFEDRIDKVNGVWLLEAHNSGSRISDSELKLLELKFRKVKTIDFFQAKGELYLKKAEHY